MKRRRKKVRESYVKDLIALGLSFTAFITSLTQTSKLNFNVEASSNETSNSEVVKTIESLGMDINDLTSHKNISIDLEETPDIALPVEQVISESVINDLNDRVKYEINTNMDEYTLNYMLDHESSEIWNNIFKYSSYYGMDPYLMLSLSMTESALVPEVNYGLFQIMYIVGQEYTRINLVTGEMDTIYITNNIVNNPETNIQAGIMMFADLYDRYQGNLVLALQAYNYGYPVVDMIVYDHAVKLGREISELVLDYSYEGYTASFDAFTANPGNYVSTLSSETIDRYYNTYSEFKYRTTTYGNRPYFEKILDNHYIGTNGIFHSNDSTYLYDYIDSNTVLASELYASNTGEGYTRVIS